MPNTYKEGINLNGTSLTRKGDAIFIPLPRESWRPIGGTCSCPYCSGAVGYWDTLAVAAERPAKDSDTAWTVHYPELHGARKKTA